MRSHQLRRLPWLLALAGAGFAPPSAENPTDAALKDRGLTKAGTVYTIEAEKPALAKLKDARAAFQAYAALSGEKGKHEELAAQSAQLEENRANLQSRLDALNLQVAADGGNPNNGPGGLGPGGTGGIGGLGGFGIPGQTVSPQAQERDQVRAALAQVTAEQRTVKNQSPQPKDSTALEERIKKAEQAFKTTLGELRTQVDEVRKKYADLEADDSVKTLLADAKKANSKNRIGPSDTLNNGIKELEKAERQFLGKKPAAGPSSPARKGKPARGKK